MSANLLHACQQHLCEAGQSGLAQDLREYGASMDELIAACDARDKAMRTILDCALVSRRRPPLRHEAIMRYRAALARCKGGAA